MASSIVTVRALRRCFYGGKVRKENEVFAFEPKGKLPDFLDFLESYAEDGEEEDQKAEMTPEEPKKPAKPTTQGRKKPPVQAGTKAKTAKKDDTASDKAEPVADKAEDSSDTALTNMANKEA